MGQAGVSAQHELGYEVTLAVLGQCSALAVAWGSGGSQVASLLCSVLLLGVLHGGLSLEQPDLDEVFPYLSLWGLHQCCRRCFVGTNFSLPGHGQIPSIVGSRAREGDSPPLLSSGGTSPAVLLPALGSQHQRHVELLERVQSRSWRCSEGWTLLL